MTNRDLVRKELPAIDRVLKGQAWVESRRRRRPVSPHDPAVQLRAAHLILSGLGDQLRRSCEAVR